MTPTKLEMQPTIHMEGKAGFLPRPDPALPSKCIVLHIITPESPCIFYTMIFCRNFSNVRENRVS
jgi:hypothetical protein